MAVRPREPTGRSRRRAVPCRFRKSRETTGQPRPISGSPAFPLGAPSPMRLPRLMQWYAVAKQISEQSESDSSIDGRIASWRFQLFTQLVRWLLDRASDLTHSNAAPGLECERSADRKSTRLNYSH